MSIIPVSLKDLNLRVKETLENNFTQDIWIVGEIAEFNLNSRGHCYLDLIERDETTDKVVARSRATIWAYTYRILAPYFESTTRQSLQEGMKVMIKVSVSFHEVYGLSLNVKDIDPKYTIGEQELRRKKIIEQLMQDGVFEMNRELEIPLCPRKIAVVSSSTAAGYQDFVMQLKNNPYGYSFNIQLFNAVMQGADTESSVIDALNAIFASSEVFDVVVLIRGGGAKIDLSSFDSYDLSYYITQYPVPVITGIGHDKDDTVVDMVAHTKLKTPTAVADFIIQQIVDFETHIEQIGFDISESVREKMNTYKDSLDDLINRITNKVTLHVNSKREQLYNIPYLLKIACLKKIQRWNQNLNNTSNDFRKLASVFLREQHLSLNRIDMNIVRGISNKIDKQKQYLENAQKSLLYLDPKNTLKRGFSITMHNSEVIKNAETLNEGDTIETIYFKGKSVSTIKKDNNA